MYLYGHALKELKQMLVSLEASHVTLSRMEFALRPRLGLKQLLLILLLSASNKKKSLNLRMLYLDQINSDPGIMELWDSV